jgi:hypothetical protein
MAVAALATVSVISGPISSGARAQDAGATPSETPLEPAEGPASETEPPPDDGPAAGSTEDEAAVAAEETEPAPPPSEPASGSTGTTSGEPSATAPAHTGQGAAQGGSSPAPTMPPPKSVTTSDDEPEEEDDPRDTDILWLEPQFGYSYVNLAVFKQSNFLPAAERREDNGYFVGLGLGFRIKFFTLGGRVAFAQYSDFDVGTAGLDLGFRIPIGAFEPYVRLGIGYGWVGNADYSDPGVSQTDVFGLAADAGAGLDIYFNEYFAIGLGMDAAVLNLTRQDVRDGCSGGVCDPGNFNLEEDGDAVGLQLRAHVHLSVHL